jgi:preprotein translocase subunit YajC
MDGFLFVLIAMVAIMYMLLIRPQRQQQRRHNEMVENLKPGDEVITAGGIYGDVTEVQADRVSLEIAEDVEIEVAKRAIASIVPPEEATEAVAEGLTPPATQADADEGVGARAASPGEGDARPEGDEPVREEGTARR